MVTDASILQYRHYPLFMLFLVLPSFFVMDKFGRGPAVLTYAVISSFLFLSPKTNPLTLAKRITEKNARVILGLILLSLFVLVVVVFPLADSGFWGGGSDMDEALEISVAAILKGEYPYYLKTYLGAPITPMPGAILLSSPFVLSGLPQFQNLFWLLLFALVVFRFYGKDTALAALGVPVLLSPTVIHNLVIGSDYISNGISVLLCMLWVVQSAAFSSRERTSWLLPALCLGITLSSRLIFLPLLLPLSYFLNVHVSWRYALSVGLAAIFSFLLITIPFYLYDPAGFSPLHVMSFVGRFEAQLPGARILMLALTLFSGAIPFIVSRELSEKKLFLSCAILLIAPVVINLFFSIIIGEKINLFYSFYGIFAVFFGSVFLGLSERSSIVCQPETESRKRSLAGTGDSLC